jgi:hypothetical protein
MVRKTTVNYCNRPEIVLFVMLIVLLSMTYNDLVPFHQDIYVKSGYGSVDAKADHQLFTEYQMAPRAQLFRRDVGKVSSMDDMKYIMRQNGRWGCDI